MTRPIVSLCLLLLLPTWGCVPKADQVPPAQAQNPWKPSQISHVQVQSQTLGQVPNTSPQLPAVSPDGKWIAYLDFSGVEPPRLQSLFNGQGLESTSLHIQAVAPDAQPRMICNSGAAWPTWSADSKTLLFVSYTSAGRCDLVVHKPQTADTRRLSISAEPIITPALSPSGTNAAVVVYDSQSQTSRLHVVNLSTGQTEHVCPSDSPANLMVWPQWTSGGSIVFVLIQDGQSRIVQWSPGKSGPRQLATINVPASPVGICRAFAGLALPLSPDARHFAYYDAQQDRIVLVGLTNGRNVELPATTRAGCWFGSERFIAADDEQMRLFTVPPSSPALLRRAPCLPRSADVRSRKLTLCARAAEPYAFSLERMTILSAE